MRLALVAREFYPFLGGGIAPIVAAAARYLAPVAEVTVVTSAGYRDDYERLRREGDPRLPPPSVRFVFVEEPHRVEWGAFLSYMHAYSARVDRALREAFPDRGPDLLEFCDYLGEGFVTTQARRAHDPWLEHTRLCVRLHTTSYFCSVLDGHLPDDFADQDGLRGGAVRASATPTPCSGQGATCSTPTGACTALTRWRRP